MSSLTVSLLESSSSLNYVNAAARGRAASEQLAPPAGRSENYSQAEQTHPSLPSSPERRRTERRAVKANRCEPDYEESSSCSKDGAPLSSANMWQPASERLQVRREAFTVDRSFIRGNSHWSPPCVCARLQPGETCYGLWAATDVCICVCVCVLLVVLLNVNHLFSVNLSLNGSPSVLRLNAPIHVTQTTMCSSAAFLCW